MRSISLGMQTRTLTLALFVAPLVCLVGIAGTPTTVKADDTPFVYEPAIDPAKDPLTGEAWYETETPTEGLQDQSTATAPPTATATGSASATATATASAVEAEALSDTGGSTNSGGTGGVLLLALGAGVLLVAGGGFLIRGR
jgi:hypothetical protein